MSNTWQIQIRKKNNNKPYYTHPEIELRSVQKQVRERAKKTLGELETAENTINNHCISLNYFYVKASTKLQNVYK